jgi:hypothetical protein
LAGPDSFHAHLAACYPNHARTRLVLRRVQVVTHGIRIFSGLTGSSQSSSADESSGDPRGDNVASRPQRYAISSTESSLPRAQSNDDAGNDVPPGQRRTPSSQHPAVLRSPDGSEGARFATSFAPKSSADSVATSGPAVDVWRAGLQEQTDPSAAAAAHIERGSEHARSTVPGSGHTADADASADMAAASTDMSGLSISEARWLRAKLARDAQRAAPSATERPRRADAESAMADAERIGE